MQSMKSTKLTTIVNMKRSLTGVIAASLLLVGTPVFAGPEDEPSASEMVADVVVARPAGLLITAIGAGAFLVSLPFSALGGNVDKAAETLVLNPARETFQRCLGCTNAGRYRGPKDD